MVYDSEGSVSLEAIFQSGNLYGYCGNEPVNRMDPTGEIFMLVTAAIGAAIGGIGGAIYSKVKYGEVRWQNVATGAAIGGVVGLTGGAAAGVVFAGSATASTGAVLTGMGIAGATAAGGASGIMAKKVAEAISNTIPNSINHILQSKHAWDLVGKPNWANVSKAINYTIINGSSLTNKAGNTIYSIIYKGKTIEVTTRIVNGAFRIVDAWVRTKK